MRDSDWSRPKMLRSDWLGLIGAIITTKDFIVSFVVNKRFGFFIINHLSLSLLSLNYYYYYYYYYCHYCFIVIFLLLLLFIIIR